MRWWDEKILRANKERRFFEQLKQRRRPLIGHTPKNDGLVKRITEGPVEGKVAEEDLVWSITDDMNCGCCQLKRKAGKQQEWRAATNQLNDW